MKNTASTPSPERIESAVQLVVMDAIAKGHIDISEIVAYMHSDACMEAVNGYLALMQESF